MKRRDIIQSIAATTSIVAIGTIIPGWRKVFAKQPPSAPAIPPSNLKPVTYPNSPPTDSSGLRILASEPTIAITPEGQATISWQTIAPTQGGSIYIGIPDYNQQLEYPIYSQVVKLDEAQPTTTHQGSIDLSQYLKTFAPSYITKGEGVIAYRLDIPTLKRTNNLFHDRDFRVVKSKDGFRLGVHISEGPFVTQTTKDSAIDRTTPVHLDKTPNPKFRSRVWQIIQGAAGAPFYPQEQTVPWIGGVKKFVAPTWAYTIISVRGDVVKLDTYSYTGELLDSANLGLVV